MKNKLNTEVGECPKCGSTDPARGILSKCDKEPHPWHYARGDSPRPQGHDLRNCPAMRALEHLTVGGSEFVDDIPRCVEYIRKKQETLQDVAKNAVKARQEAEAPSQQQVYRKALEAIAQDPIIGNEVLDPAAWMYRGIAKRALGAEASRQPSTELADEIVSIVFEEIDRDGDWMSSREFAVERVQKKLRESEHSEPAKETGK